MPAIQIAITKIAKKTPKAGDSANHEEPPRPGFTLAQRKLRQPDVKRTDGDQRAAEGNPIMKHEVDNAAALDPAKLFGGHAEKLYVVRKKVARG